MTEHSKYLIDFNSDDIINLLANDNFIIVNKSLIKIFGLKEAIMLGELASEYRYYKENDLLDNEGYFFSTIDNIQNNILLSSYEQKKCLDNLSKMGIVEVSLKGIPAKRYIKINSFQLINLLSNNSKPSFQKIKKLASKKIATNNINVNNNKENINNINIINTKERFKKPTLEEVSEYCKERHNTIDPEQFIDYYESKGWMIGKNKMKDWKASVRLWERNRKSKEDVPEWFDTYNNEESELSDEDKEFIARVEGRI